MSRVLVHIDRLVLQGFGSGEHAGIVSGLKHELQRLLAQRDRAGELAGVGDLPHLRVDRLRLVPGMPPVQIGALVARGIAGGLATGARSDDHG